MVVLIIPQPIKYPLELMVVPIIQGPYIYAYKTVSIEEIVFNG